MDLNAVMDQIGARLATIPDLQILSYPPSTVTPPSAVVDLPEITFDGTYGRGMDRMQLPVSIILPKVVDDTTRKLAAEYVAGSGARSIKQVLESGTYTAFHTIQVASVDFEMVAFNAVEYLAANFTLALAGQGA